MPKNKGKGGKNRRRGKNENEQAKRELELKEPGQEYGQVQKILGNGRVRCYCFDGKERLCNIRGKLRKKTWINTNDIVLLGLRDYQDCKADVIQKYNPDEARRLKTQGHIPDNINIEDGAINEEDAMINFRNENDDDADLVENDEEAIPEQPDRYVNLSDEMSSSESESEGNEDDIEENGFDSCQYSYDASNFASRSVLKKKEINLDEI